MFILKNMRYCDIILLFFNPGTFVNYQILILEESNGTQPTPTVSELFPARKLAGSLHRWYSTSYPGSVVTVWLRKSSVEKSVMTEIDTMEMDVTPIVV